MAEQVGGISERGHGASVSLSRLASVTIALRFASNERATVRGDRSARSSVVGAPFGLSVSLSRRVGGSYGCVRIKTDCSAWRTTLREADRVVNLDGAGLLMRSNASSNPEAGILHSGS